MMALWDWLDGKKRVIACILSMITAAAMQAQADGLPIPHLDLVIKGLGYAAGGMASLGVAHAAWKAKAVGRAAETR